jgi:hypothetical protein
MSALSGLRFSISLECSQLRMLCSFLHRGGVSFEHGFGTTVPRYFDFASSLISIFMMVCI